MAEQITVDYEAQEDQIPVAVQEEMAHDVGETALMLDETGVVLTSEEAAKKKRESDHWLNTRGH